jgi:hypothetical protein
MTPDKIKHREKRTAPEPLVFPLPEPVEVPAWAR